MFKSPCYLSSKATLLGSLALLASTATLRSQTVNVNVNNPSFETPVVADGASSVGLSNWLVVGNLLGALNNPLNETVLTSNPVDAQYIGTTGAGSVGTMQGSQIASFRTGLLNLVGGSATQLVPTGLLTLNTQYTLTVAVGNPLDSIFQGYTVSVLAGTTSLASVSNLGVDVANGTFRDVSLIFTLGDLAPLATAGGLTINLTVPDGITLGSGFGTDFDNVRLTATPFSNVPEPSTYASVGAGLLGLIGTQIAKRRRSFPRCA